MEYQPKLSHAILAVILSVAMFAWSDGKTGNVYGALLFGAGAFFFMFLSIVWMMVYTNHLTMVIRYIEAYIKLDPVQRSELGFNVPSLRLVVRRGKVSELFEDTQATIEHMRLFLTDSTRNHTASEHAWNTGARPRWAWVEIYDWLTRHHKVVPDSAAGSHSYQWNGNAYQGLMFYWLTASIPDLNDERRAGENE